MGTMQVPWKAGRSSLYLEGAGVTHMCGKWRSKKQYELSHVPVITDRKGSRGRRERKE